MASSPITGVHNTKDNINASTSFLNETNDTPTPSEGSTKKHALDVEWQAPEDIVERKPWDRKLEFILSMVGYAVGLGNIWRFPYKAYKNGGGSFLIPYFFMVMLVGLPAYFLESALGQYAGQGPTRVYGRLAPALKGIGFGMVLTTFLVTLYYNVVIAWGLFYMFNGMQSPLPWTNCANDTRHCHEGKIDETIKEADPYAVGPAEDYFNHAMLGFDKAEHSWTNFGGMRWEMVLCMAGAWVIVCLCSIKGVQSSGKVVYFTALFPYLVLITLLGYALTFDGSVSVGIWGFIEVKDWTKVADVTVWKEAATQIIYSLCPGLGGLITLSSYNKFNNNCHRDALLVVFVNCATSIFAGVVVFAYLGVMAHDQGLTDVTKVVDGGLGLVFMAYPSVLAKMGTAPVPQILSFLFFLMIITLGLDSMLGCVETVTTTIVDHFTRLNRSMVVVITCVISFILGLSMCAEGGMFMFDLLDRNVIGWNVLVLIMLEIVAVAWIYGADNFLGNIEDMGMKLRKPTRIYWKACWYVVTPVVISVLVISSLKAQGTQTSTGYSRPGGTEFIYSLPGVKDIKMTKSEEIENATITSSTTEGTYKQDGITWQFKMDSNTTSISYVWPDGSEPGQPNIQALGWLIALASILLVPAVGIYQVCKRAYHGNSWRGFVMFQPTRHWRPNPFGGSDSTEDITDQKANSSIIKRQLSANGC